MTITYFLKICQIDKPGNLITHSVVLSCVSENKFFHKLLVGVSTDMLSIFLNHFSTILLLDVFTIDMLEQMKDDTCKKKYRIVGRSKILQKS